MAMHIPSFHSISRISEWLVTLSVGIIITSIITLVLASYENLQYLFVGGTDDVLYEIDSVVGSSSPNSPEPWAVYQTEPFFEGATS